MNLGRKPYGMTFGSATDRAGQMGQGSSHVTAGKNEAFKRRQLSIDSIDGRFQELNMVIADFR